MYCNCVESNIIRIYEIVIAAIDEDFSKGRPN